MSAPDLSHGIAELAGLISFRVGAWHDFGYEVPPAPECKVIPPLGERSVQAIKAGHEAVDAIDELTRQLYALREQLTGELRQDSAARPAGGRAAAGPPRPELPDALAAVLEALDIPHPATVGDERVQREILHQRTLHAVVMLRSILEPDRHPDVPWSTAYLRARLAEHPAEGYKTWLQLTAELAARKNGGPS